MTWPAGAPVVYNPDQGSLGALENPVARELVARAFAEWESVYVADPLFVDDMEHGSGGWSCRRGRRRKPVVAVHGAFQQPGDELALLRRRPAQRLSPAAAASPCASRARDAPLPAPGRTGNRLRRRRARVQPRRRDGLAGRGRDDRRERVRRDALDLLRLAARRPRRVDRQLWGVPAGHRRPLAARRAGRAPQVARGDRQLGRRRRLVRRRRRGDVRAPAARLRRRAGAAARRRCRGGPRDQRRALEALLARRRRRPLARDLRRRRLDHRLDVRRRGALRHPGRRGDRHADRGRDRDHRREHRRQRRVPRRARPAGLAPGRADDRGRPRDRRPRGRPLRQPRSQRRQRRAGRRRRPRQRHLRPDDVSRGRGRRGPDRAAQPRRWRGALRSLPERGAAARRDGRRRGTALPGRRGDRPPHGRSAALRLLGGLRGAFLPLPRRLTVRPLHDRVRSRPPARARRLHDPRARARRATR